MERRRRTRVGATGLFVLLLTVVWSCEEADGCSFWKSRSLQQSTGQGSSPGTSVPSPTTVSSNTIYVDIGGTGNFASVQAAVNSIPQGNPQHTIIVVKPGTYVWVLSVALVCALLARLKHPLCASICPMPSLMVWSLVAVWMLLDLYNLSVVLGSIDVHEWLSLLILFFLIGASKRQVGYDHVASF